jgi:hypothetical protein
MGSIFEQSPRNKDPEIKGLINNLHHIQQLKKFINE